MLHPSSKTCAQLIVVTVFALIVDVILLIALWQQVPAPEQRFITEAYKRELASAQYLNLTDKAKAVWLKTNIIFDRHYDANLCSEAACYYPHQQLIVIQSVDRQAPEAALTQVLHELLHVLVDEHGIPASVIDAMKADYAADRNDMLKMKLGLYGYSEAHLNWSAQTDFRTTNRPINELHSLFGAEPFTTISAELEAYYRQYFNDRHALINRLESSICNGDWQTLLNDRLQGTRHHFRQVVRAHQTLVTDDKLQAVRQVWQARCTRS